MSALAIKQGDTFAIALTFQDANGTPVSLTGCQFESQIRDALGNMVATLRCTLPAGVPGTVNLWGGSAAAWPLGRLFCDVSVVWPDGVIRSTETFGIIVQKSIASRGSTS